MKKECDLLLAIIEKKKAELLENINSAYNDKLNELHETIRRCDKTLQQSLGLVEFSEEAFKENNPVTFLQVLDKIRCVYNINNNTLGPNLCSFIIADIKCPKNEVQKIHVSHTSFDHVSYKSMLKLAQCKKHLLCFTGCILCWMPSKLYHKSLPLTRHLATWP